MGGDEEAVSFDADLSEEYETYQAIEALLMVASEPLSFEELCRYIDADRFVVQDALDQLKHHYDETRRGFYLAEIAGGYQLRTRVELGRFVGSYVKENYGTKLSKAALETLSIVAYRQPISRAQISQIRGVNSDGVVRLLTTRGYIAPTLREEGLGQAALYTTTVVFLERLGLYDLNELPKLADFVPALSEVEAIEAALLGE